MNTEQIIEAIKSLHWYDMIYICIMDDIILFVKLLPFIILFVLILCLFIFLIDK